MKNGLIVTTWAGRSFSSLLSSRPMRKTPPSTYIIPSGGVTPGGGEICESVEEEAGALVETGEASVLAPVVSLFSLPLPRSHAPTPASNSNNTPTPTNKGVRDLACAGLAGLAAACNGL